MTPTNMSVCCGIEAFADSPLACSPIRPKRSFPSASPLLMAHVDTHFEGHGESTFAPSRPLTPRSPYTSPELELLADPSDGIFTRLPPVNLSSVPAICPTLRHLQRKGSVTSVHTMPIIVRLNFLCTNFCLLLILPQHSPPIRSFYQHTRSRSAASFRVPSPISVPGRKPQKSIVDSDSEAEEYIPVRKSSLGSETAMRSLRDSDSLSSRSSRRQGMHFTMPEQGQDTAFRQALSEYRFGAPSSPREVLAPIAVPNALPRKDKASYSVSSTSISTSSGLASPISFEPDLRSKHRHVKVDTESSVSLNSLRVSKILQDLDATVDFTPFAHPFEQKTLTSLSEQMQAKELDNALLKGLDSISHEEQRLLIAPQDDIDACEGQLAEECAEMQRMWTVF